MCRPNHPGRHSYEMSALNSASCPPSNTFLSFHSNRAITTRTGTCCVYTSSVWNSNVQVHVVFTRYQYGTLMYRYRLCLHIISMELYCAGTGCAYLSSAWNCNVQVHVSIHRQHGTLMCRHLCLHVISMAL